MNPRDSLEMTRTITMYSAQTCPQRLRTTRRARRTEDNAKASAALKLAERASQALTFRHKNLHLNKNASAPHSGAEYLLTKRTFVGLNPNKKENDDNGEEEHPLEATEGEEARS